MHLQLHSFLPSSLSLFHSLSIVLEKSSSALNEKGLEDKVEPIITKNTCVRSDDSIVPFLT